MCVSVCTGLFGQIVSDCVFHDAPPISLTFCVYYHKKAKFELRQIVAARRKVHRSSRK